jgi:nitrogen fixation NifU-like protein
VLTQAETQDDLLSLYQETILDHGRSPRNTGLIKNHACIGEGRNPMCGDRVTVTAALEGDVISELRFDGKGCAISIASASMMTDALKGLDRQEATQLFDAVHTLCTEDIVPEEIVSQVGEKLGKRLERLVALTGVRQFPVRVKCATLPWHALKACLAGQGVATTEK